MKLKRTLNSFQNTSSDAATNSSPYNSSMVKPYNIHWPTREVYVNAVSGSTNRNGRTAGQLVLSVAWYIRCSAPRQIAQASTAAAADSNQRRNPGMRPDRVGTSHRNSTSGHAT
jgi:hypothetical protein